MQKVIDMIEVKQKYIFVDCFDTIIFRNCHPDTVIDRWLQNIAQLYDIEVEKVAAIWEQTKRTRNNSRVLEEEDPFSVICKSFFERLECIKDLGCSDRKFYEIVLDLMIRIELAVQRINSPLVDYLTEEKSKGKKVYCITDFYLPKTAIQAFFEHHGILKLFDGIYVSSDIGFRKSSGTLFKFVVNDLNCFPSDAIMIGDNKKSDYEMAQKAGLSSFQYRAQTSEPTQSFISFSRELLSKEQKDGNPFGIYALSLYGFCARLYKELSKESFDQVFFFAREGEALIQMFERYIQINSLPVIKAHYLYVSRQATYLPSLKTLEEESFESLRLLSKRMSILDFIDSLGLTDCMQKKLPSYFENRKYDEPIADFFASQEFEDLCNDKKFKQLYEEERKLAQINAQKYFASHGIVSGSHVAVVDIGWRGTIQDNIFRIFNGNIDLHGYYYGLLGDVHTSRENKKYGLVFGDYPVKSEYYNTFKISYRFLENLLQASHGSCTGYIDGLPVFALFESNEREMFELAINHRNSILKMFDDIAGYANEYLLSDFEFWEITNKLQKAYCLSMSKATIHEMDYMYARLKHNFGERTGKTPPLKQLIKIVKSMSKMEICSKILIQMEKRHLSILAIPLRHICFRLFV